MDLVIDTSGLARAAPTARSYGREMLRALLDAGSEHHFRFPAWPHSVLGSVERFLGPLSAAVKARIGAPPTPDAPWLWYSPVGPPAACQPACPWPGREPPLARVATVLDEEPGPGEAGDATVIALARSAFQRLIRRRNSWRQQIVWIPPGLSRRRPYAAGGGLPRSPRLPQTDYLLAQGAPRAEDVRSRRAVWMLLRAFGALRRRVSRPLRLVLLGAMPLSLRSMAALCGLTRDVELVDSRAVDDDELERLVAGAMAFVHTSRIDESWLVAADAMRCGVPVVVPSTAFAADLWGDAGVYYDAVGPADLARALEHLTRSADLRRLYAQRGIARGHAFTWEACARRALDWFGALSQPRRRDCEPLHAVPAGA